MQPVSPPPLDPALLNPTHVVGRRITAFLIDALIGLALVFGTAAATFTNTQFEDSFTAELQCEVINELSDDLCIAVDDTVFVGLSDDLGVVALVWIGWSLLATMIIPGITGWSPGKLVMGLRIAKVGTFEKAGFGANLTRGIVWIVDAFPYLFPAFGGVMMLATSDHRRLGDYAAGTVVIRAASLGRPPVQIPSPSAAPAPGVFSGSPPPPTATALRATPPPPPSGALPATPPPPGAQPLAPPQPGAQPLAPPPPGARPVSPPPPGARPLATPGSGPPPPTGRPVGSDPSAPSAHQPPPPGPDVAPSAVQPPPPSSPPAPHQPPPPGVDGSPIAPIPADDDPPPPDPDPSSGDPVVRTSLFRTPITGDGAPDGDDLDGDLEDPAEAEAEPDDVASGSADDEPTAEAPPVASEPPATEASAATTEPEPEPEPPSAESEAPTEPASLADDPRPGVGTPTWDDARDTYIQWDPELTEWMEWSESAGKWVPISR